MIHNWTIPGSVGHGSSVTWLLGTYWLLTLYNKPQLPALACSLPRRAAWLPRLGPARAAGAGVARNSENCESGGREPRGCGRSAAPPPPPPPQHRHNFSRVPPYNVDQLYGGKGNFICIVFFAPYLYAVRLFLQIKLSNDKMKNNAMLFSKIEMEWINAICVSHTLPTLDIENESLHLVFI